MRASGSIVQRTRNLDRVLWQHATCQTLLRTMFLLYQAMADAMTMLATAVTGHTYPLCLRRAMYRTRPATSRMPYTRPAVNHQYGLLPSLLGLCISRPPSSSAGVSCGALPAACSSRTAVNKRWIPSPTSTIFRIGCIFCRAPAAFAPCLSRRRLQKRCCAIWDIYETLPMSLRRCAAAETRVLRKIVSYPIVLTARSTRSVCPALPPSLHQEVTGSALSTL